MSKDETTEELEALIREIDAILDLAMKEKFPATMRLACVRERLKYLVI